MASACAAGPSQRPDLAMSGHSDGIQGEPSEPEPDASPAMETPRSELDWRDCTAKVRAGLALPAGPSGLRLECATLKGDLDPETTIASVDINLLRASTAATPPDAPPVVVTTGADQASTDALAVFATGSHPGLLDQYPLVAVDRRGLSAATDPDCMTSTDRIRLTDAAGRTSDPSARAEAMMGTVSDATVSCTDILRPSITAQDSLHAASDLDVLRQAWGVDRLALLAVGSGSRVALAFTTALPDAVSRLILDSPASLEPDATVIAEHLAQADQSALAALVQLCAAADCGLGPDPAGQIDEFLGKVRAGSVPNVSEGGVLTIMRQRLAAASEPWEARAAGLGRLIADANSGNQDAIGTFAGAVAITDGQFTATCSDSPPPATPEQSAELQPKWRAQYPQFGADAAVRMLVCAAWPSHTPAPAPDRIPLPVLLLSGAADPVVGSGSADTVTAALNRTGTASSTITWAGVGHGAIWGSACAVDNINGYLESGRLPDRRTACPA